MSFASSVRKLLGGLSQQEEGSPLSSNEASSSLYRGASTSSLASLSAQATSSSLYRGVSSSSLASFSAQKNLSAPEHELVAKAATELRSYIGELERGVGSSHIQQIFMNYDVDGNGKFELEEFRAAMKELGVSTNDDVIESLFARYDVNCQGYILFDEFVKEARRATEGTSNESEVERIMFNLRKVLSQKKGISGLKKVFESYDSDGSGALDVSEFVKSLEDLGVAPGAKVDDVKAVFKRFDVDDSGSLDFLEFVKAIQNGGTANLPDKAKLNLAREKRRLIDLFSAQKQSDETRLKELIHNLETNYATEHGKSSDPKLRLDERVECLERSRVLQEQLHDAKEELAKKQNEWAGFNIKLDEEDMRFLRGFQALEGMRKKLTEDRKPAPKKLEKEEKKEKEKTVTQAEVKAKQKKVETELKTLSEEEENFKARIKKEKSELEEVQRQIQQMQASNFTTERVMLLTNAHNLAHKLEESQREYEKKQEEWKRKRENLKYTPDEERILRGMKAIQAAKQIQQAEKPAVVTPKALASASQALQRAKSKINLRERFNKDANSSATKIREQISQLEKSIETGELGSSEEIDAVSKKIAYLKEELEKLSSLQHQDSLVISASEEKIMRGVQAFKSVLLNKSSNLLESGEGSTSKKSNLMTEYDEATETARKIIDAARRIYAADGVDKLKETFKKYDKSNMDMLDIDEWKAFVKELGIEAEESTVEDVFLRFNDETQTLMFEHLISELTKEHTSLDSLRIQVRHIFKHQRGVQALKRVFEQHDADGNGELDCDEFILVIRKFGIVDATDSDIRLLFDEFDLNKSGSIEFFELLQAVRSNAETERKDQAELLRMAKEKEKFIQKMREQREKEERLATDNRIAKQNEIAEFKRVKPANLHEQLAHMRQEVLFSEQLEALIMEERDVLERWKKVAFPELTEEERKAVRFMTALNAMKKADVTKQFQKYQKPAQGKDPTVQEVRNKVQTKERLQKEFEQMEQTLTKEYKNYKSEFDQLQAQCNSSANSNASIQERTQMLSRLATLSQIMNEPLELLEKARREFEEKLAEYALTEEETRIYRGYTASLAMRRKTYVGDFLRKAKPKATDRKSAERIMQDALGLVSSRTRLIEEQMSAADYDEAEDGGKLKEDLKECQDLEEVLLVRLNRPPQAAAPADDDAPLPEADQKLLAQIQQWKVVMNIQDTDRMASPSFGEREEQETPVPRKRTGKIFNSKLTNYSYVTSEVQCRREYKIPTVADFIYQSEETRLRPVSTLGKHPKPPSRSRPSSASSRAVSPGGFHAIHPRSEGAKEEPKQSAEQTKGLSSFKRSSRMFFAAFGIPTGKKLNVKLYQK